MALSVQAALQIVGRLERKLQHRRTAADKLKRYFRGEQPLAYTSGEWKAFHGERYKGFSDNWCGVVASTTAERLRLQGFRLGDPGKKRSAAEKRLQADWDRNELDSRSSQGFLDTIITGRSFALVWPDEDDLPIVTWETSGDVIVEYDAFDRPLYALKVWTEDRSRKATLYTADALYKFQRASTGGHGETLPERGPDGLRTATGLLLPGGVSVDMVYGWQQRDDDEGVWPLPNPLGELPVVEFTNRPMLAAEPLSDIAGTVAMQDAVNLLWSYLFGAADFASLPARVVLGTKPPTVPILDERGQAVGERHLTPEQLTHGRLLFLSDPNAKVDGWSAAALDVFTDVINICVRHVAAQTRTPVHYIVGELSNVNGETLLAGETGQVRKVQELQICNTGATRRLNRLMALCRDDQATAAKCVTGLPQWKDAETRSTAQQADAAVKDVAVGMPLAWICRERYGMSDAQVEEVLAMRQAELDSEDAVMNRVLRPDGEPEPDEQRGAPAA